MKIRCKPVNLLAQCLMVIRKKQVFLDHLQPFSAFATLKGKATIVIDEKLIERCRKQQRTAQREVYEYMAPKLYSTCRRYLKREDEIEDILSESFYTIFTKLHQLKNLKAFEGWARRITVNRCLQEIRKKVNFNLYIDDVGAQAETVATVPTESDRDDLLGLVDELPDGAKTIFNLFVIEGYSHKEIAQQLSIAEGTSKSQLSVAKNKLKDLVNTFYYKKAEA